ncbi:MAG TPA: response regulator [bacterium]
MVEKKTVMIIDDDFLVAKSISRYFNRDKFNTFVFGDGNSALEWMGGQLPDLVILDVQMPALDGFEVLGRIKQIKSDIPVIMVSGNLDDEKCQKLKKHGANACMEKPVDGTNLLFQVNQLIHLIQP